MLPKPNRLNLKTDFKWVASGKKIEEPLFKLFIKYGDNKLPRIGIATSSKVYKTAVERNRSRRLLSKGFEELLPQLDVRINIVAMPKTDLIKANSEEVKNKLSAMLEGVK